MNGGDIRGEALRLADTMPRIWGTDPISTMRGEAADGIAAVRLRVRGPALEVCSPPSPVHIVSFVLGGDPGHRLWHDSREVYDGDLGSRTVNIVPAGVAPRAIVNKGLDVLHVYVPDAVVRSHAEAIEPRCTSIEVTLIDPRHARDSVAENLVQALLQSDCGGAAGRLFLDGWGLSFTAHLLRTYSNLTGSVAMTRRTSSGGLAPLQVRRVCDYLQSRLDHDVSLGELAGLVDQSTFHFCRAFKQSTGISPHAWLVARRIERATELLVVDPRLSLTEIALSVGYSSQSAFATAFRRVTGTTPSAWRRERLS